MTGPRMIDALAADGAAADRAGNMDLYGWLIGSWDLDVTRYLEDGSTRRRPGEWQEGHIPQARHLPLNALDARASELDPSRPVTAICAGGYRSSIATSLLEQHGFRVTNVIGGMTAWNAARFEAVA